MNAPNQRRQADINPIGQIVARARAAKNPNGSHAPIKKSYARQQKSPADIEFLNLFFARCFIARKVAGFLQADAAALLKVDGDLYKHYESRTPIPHRLIPTFCQAFGVTIEWLFTGKGHGPATPREVQQVAAARLARRCSYGPKILPTRPKR